MWYRLRLYHAVKTEASVAASAEHQKDYPRPSDWCDAISSAYWSFDKEQLLGPYRCPNVAKSRCHYAMNPGCRFDSPPDLVLLFETKAGWNRHGGPSLFTFDNHEPRGGLVLLNDGTVKFIRTEDELKRLRWK
jgi:hypothetical protein